MSRHVHSHYERHPLDLPSSGKSVRLVLKVRRFRCRNSACRVKVFCERIPAVVVPSAQRTVRLTETLNDVGFVLGGKAGSRHSKRRGMAVSVSTLLRYIRRCPIPVAPTPRVLGVDDFALHRGRSYGTLLVDGETHRPVELLADRTAEVLAGWLREHPGVQVITRDRSTEYARGASQGAPTAIQVADRWHLLVNFREAFERLLDRLRAQLVAYSTSGTLPITIYDRSRRRGTKDQARQQASRARRYERYAQVKSLQAQGLNILQIAKQLHLSRQTVRKYIASETFPDIQRSQRQKSILDPYAAYLQARWEEGCHDSRRLWREIREQGYPGSYRMVWLWVALRREPEQKGRTPARQVQIFQPSVSGPSAARVQSTLPASRRLVWVFIHPPDKLDEEQLQLRDTLRQIPDVERAFALAQRFLSLVRQRQPALLQPWIDDCRASGLPELTSFADGLQREFSIIYAALELPYSNGVTEGHVNRLKFLKRQMYGRANFDLLRRRVLAVA
jgi:transposase